eukprot:59652_1
MSTPPSVQPDNESPVLSSQQLLDESIACISTGIQLEDSHDFHSALAIYEKGISLLTKAKAMETNTDVLPIISANLDSIQERINAVRDKLQYDSMVMNMQQMQQKSMNLLNEYNDLNQQRASLNHQYDELIHTVNNFEFNIDNDTRPQGADVNVDDFLSNLYQQYYGEGNAYDVDECDEQKSIELDPTDATSHVSHKTQSVQIIDTIEWSKYDETALIASLPNDITGHIFVFLSGRQVTTLFAVSKSWCYCLLYDAVFSHLWKRIIIGADPIRNSLGHNLQLKWLNRKICVQPIRVLMETLIISTAGLALDALKSSSVDEQLYVLRQAQFPSLRTLLLYGWSDLKVMSLKMVFKHNLSQLTALYMESPIDILDICTNVPNLRILQCNVINCTNLQLVEKHKFASMMYLSFVYGVDDFILNRIFYCFPNLVHLGVEFDEIASSLRKLLRYKTNRFSVLHMSWNRASFWGVNKNRTQKDVECWLFELQNVNTLVLDRDYVFDDDDKTENVEALGALQCLLPSIELRIAGGECTYNLTTFATFCGLL